MHPLERLFRLEVEFHRQIRETGERHAAAAAHTSYAMQNRYEALIAACGAVEAAEVTRLANRLLLAGDTRDVLQASDSVKSLFGIPHGEA